jgi:hypothetical protein
LILLDEYPIDHAIYQLGDGDFNVEGLQLGYKKLYNFIGLSRKPNAGLTCIVTKSWMFMAILTQPYHRETDIDLPEPTQDGGIPVYLDGFAYAGILNMQDVIQQWPATTGIGVKRHSILNALETQSREVVFERPDINATIEIGATIETNNGEAKK